MRCSQRTRLAAFSMAVVGLLLAAIFAAAVLVARRVALADEQGEVRLAFDTVARLRGPEFSMEELGEAGPYLKARVYGPGERPVAIRGRWPAGIPEIREGFAEQRGWLVFGGRAKGRRIALATSLSEIDRGVATLTLVLAVLWVPLTLLVGAATWHAAQSVFRPLDRLAASAARIGGSDLSSRLPAPDRAEFGALSEVLNRMLDRIGEARLRADRFAADAAHELRTPLAILQAQIETTLLRPRAPGEYVDSLRVQLNEVERVTGIVEALLRASRSGAESAPPFDLAPVVRAASERFADPRIELRLQSAIARVLPEEVAILVDNLLDNARRFSPEDRAIRLTLSDDGAGVEMSVADEGPGVPVEHRERIFDRLYRVDDARNRAAGGSGIGLAVCRQIVEARGGTLDARDTSGGGATIVVRLPRA